MSRVESAAPTQRDVSIDALKGVAIVGVLIIHADFDRFHANVREWVQLGAFLFQWSVPAFFYAAGAIARHPASALQLKNFMQRRANRLLVPLVAFAGLYKVALSMLGKDSLDNWGSLGGPQLYFLAYLFGISSVVAGVMVSRRRGILLSFFVGAVGATAFLSPAIPTHGAHPELLGLYAASYIGGIVASQSSRFLSAAILLLSGVFLSSVIHSIHPLSIAVPPLLSLVLWLFERSSVISIFGWLGYWSAAIFVWHTPIIMPVASIISVRAFGAGFAALASTLVLTVSGALFAGYVAQKIPCRHPFQI